MTRFQTLVAVAAALLALPALAHDGVHIENPYVRTMGGIGTSGAVFLEIANHADVDDRLVDVASDVAEMVQLHTHKDNGDGVMQMMHVPEGFAIPALGNHALKRGGDHVMMMGLTRELKDGDMVHLTLTFEHAGIVEIDAPVDNVRKADAGGMDHSKMGHGMVKEEDTTGHAAHKGHDMSAMVDTTGLSDTDAITVVMKAQFDTPDNPLTVAPVTVEGDHALAGWVQGDKGGRTLLERRDGRWVIVLCGGADLRLPEFLGRNGVSAAETLSKMHNDAEDDLGADKVALFSTFEGVLMIAPKE